MPPPKPRLGRPPKPKPPGPAWLPEWEPETGEPPGILTWHRFEAALREVGLGLPQVALLLGQPLSVFRRWRVEGYLPIVHVLWAEATASLLERDLVSLELESALSQQEARTGKKRRSPRVLWRQHHADVLAGFDPATCAAIRRAIALKK